jgi:integrase
MGLYARGTRLWFSWTDANGKRHREPSDFEVGDEALAAKVLARGQAKIAAEKKAMVGGPRVHTEKTSLTDYVLGAPGGWLEVRRARKPGVAASEQSMFECHISPFLGQMALGEIRPRNARAFVWHLREKISDETGRTFGGRTIRSIAGLLGAILGDAASDEIIPISPYKLKRGDLPPKVDVDPLWRQLAFFEREEIEQLISDPRVPEDRQMVYALGFMTGMRPGEVAALRWERYLANEQPLGKLVVATSFCAKTHKERPTTKTSSTKLVPVHPSLAALLARWKLGGWARLMGTDPRPRDLLVPSRRRGDFRNPNDMTNSLEVDLDALGLRRRTARDWRPSFMTLVRADGAIDEIARMITHGGKKDTVGGYLRFPWANVCRELVKLRIELRGEGLVLPFRQAVGGSMTSGIEASKTAGGCPSEASQAVDITRGGSEALAQRCHSPEKQPCLQLPGEVHGLSRNQRGLLNPG